MEERKGKEKKRKGGGRQANFKLGAAWACLREGQQPLEFHPVPLPSREEGNMSWH
jgi:hypothetical protein